jgi:ABC-2 type transport system ATP-binding protein
MNTGDTPAVLISQRIFKMNDNNLAIKIDKLTKLYGKQRGVDNISLEVSKGEVFGYLGPNGAGKTTTIRTLLDFIRPTSGSATIFGLDIRRDSVETRHRIGYLQGELALYGNLTGEELLQYVANLRNGVDWNYVSELTKRLDCDLKRRLRTLSHGNRRKVGLIQALMHKPELLILDEPTNGLDPLMQHEFHLLIDEAKNEGRTVFISSHILPEVERVCDRVGIIRQGQLIAVETIETLKSRSIRQLDIRFARAIPRDSFSNIPGVRDAVVTDDTLSCTVVGSLDALVKTAARYEVINIVSHEPTLEEIFLTYYNEGKNHA